MSYRGEPVAEIEESSDQPNLCTGFELRSEN